MVKKYIPKKGDIIYMNFNPQIGREQAGKRPALVISPKDYNKITGLALVMPITSVEKHHTLEVRITNSTKIKGVILADHIKCLDWTKRSISFVEEADIETYIRAIHKLDILIDS